MNCKDEARQVRLYCVRSLTIPSNVLTCIVLWIPLQRQQQISFTNINQDWRITKKSKLGIITLRHLIATYIFLAATKQLLEHFFLSVCLSVRPSVTPFSLCSHHRIILKFSGVITIDRRYVHAKGQGQRSKVKVTNVMTPLSRFRTVPPVWIYTWWWNVAQSLMLLRRGALLFFKVISQISRSHGSKNRRIWPKLGVSGL